MPDIGIKTDDSSGPNSDGIIPKTELEVVTKDFDFAGDDLATGEAIASVDSVTITRDDEAAVVPGTDLTVDSTAFSGAVAQVTFSEGVIDIGYKVVVQITTDATPAQTLEGAGRMVIKAA
jgi:hypothetical protein